MKFTEQWLHEHLQTSASLPEITDKLTSIGLEIEAVEDLGDRLKDFIIAELVEARPHPNADRLQVCMVNVGTGEPVQVVCGAPNARAGMRGVFAPVGSDIPGTGLHLKAGDIRGVASNGMLCSQRELMLSDEHDGIIDLPADAPIGMPYGDWAGLAQAVVEINVTPNRGDCLGVRGIARDLAAADMGTLKPLTVKEIKGGFESPIHWQIDKNLPADACPLVMGRAYRNVKNTASPQWMQERLKAIGLRPISALVDITNYVTYDLGRPLHVFDSDKLHGDTLTMRFAKDGEEIVALDGKTYRLKDGMTVIADAQAVQGIGGIMGGEASGCTDTTTNVFLEVALFSPIRTAATGRALGIESDARYRFERGVDPDFVADGVHIATQLIMEICGGEPSTTLPPVCHPAKHSDSSATPIKLSIKRLQQFSGVEIEAKRAVEILQKLGFTASVKGDTLTATPPSWRSDIEGDHCLIEEILRIYGFDKVQAVSLPAPSVPQKAVTARQNRIQMAAQALGLCGYRECLSWSFASEKLTDIFAHTGADRVILSNPISANLTHMRPSVLCHLTAFAARNRDRGYGDVALFEVGPVFYGDSPEQQHLHIGGLRCGNINPAHWNNPQRIADVFDVKAHVMESLKAAQAPTDNLQTRNENLPNYYHPGKSAGLYLGKVAIAHFGELHPQYARGLDLPTQTLIFEIYIDNLPPVKIPASRTRPPFTPSPFQAVTRDFAFLADSDTPAETIIAAVRSADKKLITAVELFDRYSDDSMQGKCSLAVRVTLQSPHKTLEEEDIEKISHAIIAAVHKKTGAQLRH